DRRLDDGRVQAGGVERRDYLDDLAADGVYKDRKHLPAIAVRQLTVEVRIGGLSDPGLAIVRRIEPVRHKLFAGLDENGGAGRLRVAAAPDHLQAGALEIGREHERRPLLKRLDTLYGQCRHRSFPRSPSGWRAEQIRS